MSKIKINPGNFKFGLNYPGLVLKDKKVSPNEINRVDSK